jgi:hypothetical protein
VFSPKVPVPAAVGNIEGSPDAKWVRGNVCRGRRQRFRDETITTSAAIAPTIRTVLTEPFYTQNQLVLPTGFEPVSLP